MHERPWYFLVNNAQQGPVSESELRHLLATGQLGPDTLVWSDLLTAWTAAMEVQALAVQTAPAPAPAPGPAPAPAASLTPSELTVLFGDQFAQKAGIIGWGNYNSVLTGAPISLEQLSPLLFAAAILANERMGVIRLQLEQTKALFGLVKGQTLIATLVGPQNPWPAGSLEAELLAVLVRRPLEVKQWIIQYLREDRANPWSYSVSQVFAGLAYRGLVVPDQKGGYLASEALVAEAAPAMASPIHQLLAESQQRPVLHGLLLEQIRGAIKYRKESDNDHDWPDND